MTTTPRMIVLATSVFCVAQALAHAPYERRAGSLTRPDGTSVVAVEHYVDAILGADPVAVQFRLLDGTIITQTDRSPASVVVRRTPAGFEIYRFQTDWFPIASKVQQFDGYVLTEIPPTNKRWFSLLAHTRAHSRGYGFALVTAAILIGLWFVASRMPNRGSLAVLRLFCFVSIGLAAVMYTIVLLWMAPVSPVILCIFGAIAFTLLYSLGRFLRRHGRSKEQLSPA